MENFQTNRYIKRTQKDYPLSFKLLIVQEIERGQLTVTAAANQYGIQCRKTVVQWLKKFGNFDCTIKHHNICQNHLNKK